MDMENMDMEVMEEPMEDEVYEMEPEEGSHLSTGVAMLIGAGLTAATVAVVKLCKKLIAKHKAKKELESEDVDDHDFVEPTDDEIRNVVK